MMHVAIIGGTRHIGPFIVQLLLNAGHQVTVINRGRTRVALPAGVGNVVADRSVEGQVSDALGQLKPDAVIDMIAFKTEHVDQVITALPDIGHYVFCSTTALYGVIGETTPDESTPAAPDSDYTFGKVACEERLDLAAREQGFAYTSLRLAHPYGPGDDILYTTGRESMFLDRMRRQRAVIIPGSGLTRLHPIYAEDAARAFVHVLNRDDCMGKIFNLAGPQILTLDEYFESIARVLDVPLVAVRVPHTFFKERVDLWADAKRKFDFGFNWVHYQTAFSTTALEATGFQCPTDHDAGIALTMQWLDAENLIDASSDGDGEEKILRSVDTN